MVNDEEGGHRSVSVLPVSLVKREPSQIQEEDLAHVSYSWPGHIAAAIGVSSTPMTTDRPECNCRTRARQTSRRPRAVVGTQQRQWWIRDSQQFTRADLTAQQGVRTSAM